MKFNQIIKATAIGAAMIASAGCENADYPNIENRLYINEAASGKSFTHQAVSLTVTGETTATLNLRLAQPLEQDVRVKLGLDAGFVEEYNAENGTAYEILPLEYLTFDEEVIIEKGQSVYPVALTIKEFSTDNGEAYCIPIRIVDTDSPAPPTEASSRLLFLLTKPLLQVVPMMNTSTKPSGTGDWGVSTPEWTLEGWLWMSAFPINNQAFWSASVSEGTEIYCRFGDAAVPFDQIQIKTGGSEMVGNTKFSPNTWYHIAFTYSNNTLSMYVNGTLDNQKNIEVPNYVINNLELASSSQYWQCNAQMAQIRFWKKALNQSAIQDAMNRAVAADSEGLFGYWKLSEGEGSIFHDSTANGYDLTCAQAPTWSATEVNFSNPN